MLIKHVIFLICFLSFSFAKSSQAKPFDAGNLMPRLAVHHCKYLKNSDSLKLKKALEVAIIVYDVEKELGLPDEMRGMSLASACLESGFNPQVLGDRKFSKRKKPMAVGVFQMWKWYEKAYGVDRKDPRSSALGWLTHIKKLLPKVKRMCKFRSTERTWVAAWVTGIRKPKPKGRCFERPKHYRFFKKLRKIYDNQSSASSTKSGNAL